MARRSSDAWRAGWHHTEFGRRRDDGRFRIVHTAAGWQLLDAEWSPVAAAAFRTVIEAQMFAETALRPPRD